MGPLLQGLSKPVNDLSRGYILADIVTTIALIRVQATSMKERHKTKRMYSNLVASAAQFTVHMFE